MVRVWLLVCIGLWTVILFSCRKESNTERSDHSTHLDSGAVSDTVLSASIDTLANVRADDYKDAPLEETQQVEADDPGNFTHVFAGYLEKKDLTMVLISMFLQAENGIVSGKYFYEANPGKEDLRLKGTLEGDSLLLVEFDSSNRITGRFQGKFISDQTLEGNWSSANGKKSLPFTLKVDEMEYEQRKIIGLKAEEAL